MRLFPAVVLISSLLATGQSVAHERRCGYSEPRTLTLDYTGIGRVTVNAGSHQVRLHAIPAAQNTAYGQACASSPELLQQLHIRQERQGDRLLITLERTGTGPWFGQSYAYLDLNLPVPGDLPLEVEVSSGDVWVTGVQALSAQVSSGDLEARAIAGEVSVNVGSGEVEVYDIGALNVDSIGSGDVEARNVRGAVTVHRIGSGDFDLEGADGDVQIGSIGSGDVDIERVTGSVHVDNLGSGDLEVEDVSGNLVVRTQGSGDISYHRIGGTVEIPRRR